MKLKHIVSREISLFIGRPRRLLIPCVLTLCIGIVSWLSCDGIGFVWRITRHPSFTPPFELLKESNSRAWFENYPKELPTLVVSGDADPVGNFGKGPEYVYKQLLISGCSHTELKLYPDARHELFNEKNRDEVFSDLFEWIEKIK